MVQILCNHNTYSIDVREVEQLAGNMGWHEMDSINSRETMNKYAPITNNNYINQNQVDGNEMIASYSQ